MYNNKDHCNCDSSNRNTNKSYSNNKNDRLFGLNIGEGLEDTPNQQFYQNQYNQYPQGQFPNQYQQGYPYQQYQGQYPQGQYPQYQYPNRPPYQQYPNRPPYQQYPQYPNYPPYNPNRPPQQNSPYDQYPPQQPGNVPQTPPPMQAPQKPALMAVDPGSINGCIYRNTYIWPRNGRPYWFYPIYVGRRSVSGYRWNGFRWVYFGTDLRSIESFSCSGL